MTSSDSLPLLAAAASAASELSSRCSSSLSMDALSTMTAVTSFIDSDPDQDSNSCSNLTSFSGSESNLSNVNNSIGNGNSSPMLNNVQNLIVISSDPSPEVNRKLRPRPRLLHNGYANQMAASTEQANVSAVVVSTGSEASESVSGSDDEDQVTDYLDKLSVEVTSECCGHIGVDSETPRSEAATSNSEVSPRTQSTDSDTPVSPLITTRLAINEQDTISDESGYSEESNPSNKEHDLGGRDFLNA